MEYKMKGLGTVINALAIIAGGVLGILCKNSSLAHEGYES